MLTLNDFDYELPRELIAPYPTPKRSEARLMVLDRENGRIEHRIFKDVTDYLREGDLLVLNNTRVLPARLFGKRRTGGRVEVLVLSPHLDPPPATRGEEGRGVEVLIKPSRRIHEGEEIILNDHATLLVLDSPNHNDGIRRVQFRTNGTNQEELLRKIGRIPLPPYIDRPDEEIDRELYQTVFAEKEGAVASPTAGLHFDEELLKGLGEKGIEITYVTLHVSYGTFQPVQTEDLSQHQMYEEEFEITERAATQIQKALEQKRRIVACGTTVVRTLESAVGANQCVRPNVDIGQTRGSAPTNTINAIHGKTNLFIYPPYEFQMADLLITNFHLPRSTLLMLASAFAGRDLLFRAYDEAIRERYRFYSYGDAMLIL
ncbi:MAG: tRNA preQ1(34) S-adenosylmethionine ribosyltransferase-isomerase QueA [Candidatus Omnitrophica bacterium]|nr:tRNA preQ1(34) S-adenosylmethionine ribosyltransferase-isomerase QueA [Candidatus Omnitrophota bacterium]